MSRVMTLSCAESCNIYEINALYTYAKSSVYTPRKTYTTFVVRYSGKGDFTGSACRSSGHFHLFTLWKWKRSGCSGKGGNVLCSSQNWQYQFTGTKQTNMSLCLCISLPSFLLQQPSPGSSLHSLIHSTAVHTHTEHGCLFCNVLLTHKQAYTHRQRAMSLPPLSLTHTHCKHNRGRTGSRVFSNNSL